MLDIEIVIPSQSENDILNRLDDSYKKIVQMSNDDLEFLNALLIRENPRVVVEIGVADGGGSIVILNALKNIQNSKLYSIDLNEKLYHHSNKFITEKTGYFVGNYPDLKENWKLYTGGLALKFLDKMVAAGDGREGYVDNKKIDFCILDTVHFNPGEILDFLMVLPFLKDNAMVVFHDIKFHTNKIEHQNGITNCLLLSSIAGKKYLPEENFNSVAFPNIAAIKLDKNTRMHIFEIFNLLTLQWFHMPDEYQQNEIISFLEKYYDKYYIKYLKKVFNYQKIMWKLKHGGTDCSDKIEILLKKAYSIRQKLIKNENTPK
jgi:predicted O-methyltransferase YrrM